MLSILTKRILFVLGERTTEIPELLILAYLDTIPNSGRRMTEYGYEMPTPNLELCYLKINLLC